MKATEGQIKTKEYEGTIKGFRGLGKTTKAFLDIRKSLAPQKIMPGLL